MTDLIDTQGTGRKFAFLLLGVTVPIACYLIWSKMLAKSTRRGEIDEAHDITVEDSFPASDPPSAW